LIPPPPPLPPPPPPPPPPSPPPPAAAASLLTSSNLHSPICFKATPHTEPYHTKRMSLPTVTTPPSSANPASAPELSSCADCSTGAICDTSLSKKQGKEKAVSVRRQLHAAGAVAKGQQRWGMGWGAGGGGEGEGGLICLARWLEYASRDATPPPPPSCSSHAYCRLQTACTRKCQ
jgi:hypothetical protein